MKRGILLTLIGFFLQLAAAITSPTFVLMSLLVGLSGVLAMPDAAHAMNVAIKLNGTSVFTNSCSGAGCSASIATTKSASNGTITITNNTSTDTARVQTTAGSSTFFAKVTGAVITASGGTTGTLIPNGGITVDISATNTSGNFGTNLAGGTKAYTCAVSGNWNRVIASTGDNSVSQVCAAMNNSGSLAQINSILNFVTLTTTATSFTPSAPAQESLSQVCGTSGLNNCTPAMTLTFTAKFKKYGDKVTLPSSGEGGGSVFNVQDEGELDVHIAQGKPGVVTWPPLETVRVNFTNPDQDRPNPPGPNIPVKAVRTQACSAFDPPLPPSQCPPPSPDSQFFMMVSDVANNSLPADELPWTRSDDRSFVGTPFNGKVGDITVLKARGDFVAPTFGQGSLYFSLKGPGKTELVRIHLGQSPTDNFSTNYGSGPTGSTFAPCGENVIGLSEARFEIMSTGEFVDYNGLGNLKNDQLESVSLVLAPIDSNPNLSPQQFFKLTCFELDTKKTTLQFIPFQNETFVPTCFIESEPGRAKVFVTRAGDPAFFELADMTAQSCRWNGSVNMNSGFPDTYTFTFILDDQPRQNQMDVIFGP